MSRAAATWSVVGLGVPLVLITVAMFVSPTGTSAWSSLMVEIQAAQRALHRELATTLQAVQAEGAATAAWLVGLSFAYGVLHAIGPGHGKVVITTYLMTQRARLARGIGLSVLTSLFQGLTAVLSVGIAVALLGQSLRYAQSTADDLELLSYALVALAGLVVVVTRSRRLVAAWKANGAHAHGHDHGTEPAHASAHDHGHGHGHDDGHGHDHHHGHGHAHDDDACCGHVHGPTAEQLDAPLTWRAIAGMAIAVGIRPCAGAIVVLLVAHSLSLHGVGIAAVFAMSLGTALAVSTLAALAVHARELAIGLSGRMGGRAGNGRIALECVAVIGGLVILAFGLLLFQATWTTPVHPLRPL